MKANLFLHTDSLKCNGTDSETAYLEKLSKLFDDLMEIRNSYSADNSILVSSSLCYGGEALFQGKDIYAIAEMLDHEEKNFIYSLMGSTADVFDESLSDVEKKCAYREDETECNTIVYLNKPVDGKLTYPIIYIEFDKYQIVYGKETWHTMRRQIMGNHPGTPKEFMDECKIHFPNIVFHQNCEVSIEGYLDLIPRKIVYYLSCMNDKLREHLKEKTITDENAFLADFCGMYGFEEAGSRQGTPKKKSQYQFSFLKEGCEDCATNYVTVTCDPHMKIKSCDSNCKKHPTDFVGRIYFHYGVDEVAKDKVIVGSIGPHIS